jgi:hypothetical protein
LKIFRYLGGVDLKVEKSTKQASICTL